MPTAQQEKEAFRTHNNYIDCLEQLMNDTSLKPLFKLKRGLIGDVGRKENLIKLTKKSLDDESKIVQMDKEYSYASTSWLPIKSYYLIFNSLLTVEYIITLDNRAFDFGHKRCVEEFTRKLDDGEIKFSNSLLNQVFYSSILEYHDKSGANLSRKISLNRRYKLVMKKIAVYKFNDWKKRAGVNFNTAAGKRTRSKYLSNFKVSIFEFPYYMRIRANYRDFAFIEGISTFDTAQYFESYYSFTVNFHKAISRLENSLVRMRT